jgi:hypothetical protein
MGCKEAPIINYKKGEGEEEERRLFTNDKGQLPVVEPDF